jgi:hypothetical protein
MLSSGISVLLQREIPDSEPKQTSVVRGEQSRGRCGEQTPLFRESWSFQADTTKFLPDYKTGLPGCHQLEVNQ